MLCPLRALPHPCASVSACVCVFVPAMFASVLILKPAALPTAARGGSKAEGQQEAMREGVQKGIGWGRGPHTAQRTHSDSPQWQFGVEADEMSVDVDVGVAGGLTFFQANSARRGSGRGGSRAGRC